MWTYRDEYVTQQRDVIGYDVQALDGSIGKVDAASNEVGSTYVVVDTGAWILGKKRLIPAGVIERIDDPPRTMYLALTKDQIKNAPDLDDAQPEDHRTYDRYYSAY